MKFLNSIYMHGMPADLGMLLQRDIHSSISCGIIRDPKTEAIISNTPLWNKDCTQINRDVLKQSLAQVPDGGWAILDAEGAAPLTVNDTQSYNQNLAAFLLWQNYLNAARSLRPNIKLAPILAWQSPDGASFNAAPSWSTVRDCNGLFKRLILPLIDALAMETYYLDFPAPPSQGDRWTFNMWGAPGQPQWGWISHIHAQYNWILGLTDKPAAHVFCIESGWPGRPDALGHFLSTTIFGQCLDFIAKYEPACVSLWGTAYEEQKFRCPDGWEIGTYDQHSPIWGEVKKRRDK